MKNKFLKRLFLIVALTAMAVPNVSVFAEEIEPTTSPTPSATSEPTTSPEPTAEPSPSATTTPTPTPEVKVPEAVLNSLTVSKGSWDSKFKSNDFDYKIIVESNVSGVVITAKYDNALTVEGDIGTKSLNSGENKFSIIVTNSEGKTNTYNIKITRATDNLSLKSLKIKGQNLNEVFDANTYNYTSDITYNVQSVTVQAAADDKDATVAVSGSSNLKVGKNTVKIVVKNQAGESEEYKIVVTRGSEEDLEEKEEDDEGDGVESSEEIVTSQAVVKTDDNNDKPKGNSFVYILVVIFCVILLVIAGIGIYFYIRTGDSEKKKQKKIDKLKKKQDKINQQLTGLLPVIDVDELEDDDVLEEDKTIENTIDLEELDDDVEIEEEEKEEELPRRRRTDKSAFVDFDDLLDE